MRAWGALYDFAYRQRCADALLRTAGAAARELPCVAAVTAIANFPAWRVDAAEAASAHAGLHAVDTDFSPSLSRDRLLMAARCLTWTDDLDGINALVTQAQALQPTSPEVVYWRAWHDLAAAARDDRPLPSSTAAPAVNESAEANHLRLLIDVYRSQALEAVETYLDVFLETLARHHVLEEPDRQLALTVLEGVLTLDWRAPDDELAHGDTLCERILTALAQEQASLSWCRYGRAVHALCVEADAATALVQSSTLAVTWRTATGCGWRRRFSTAEPRRMPGCRKSIGCGKRPRNWCSGCRAWRIRSSW